MREICNHILNKNEEIQVTVESETAWIGWVKEGYFILFFDDEDCRLILRTQLAFISFPAGRSFVIHSGSATNSNYEISTVVVPLRLKAENSFYNSLFSQFKGKMFSEILHSHISVQSLFRTKSVLTEAEIALVLALIISAIELKKSLICRMSVLQDEEESVFLIAEKIILEMDEDLIFKDLVRAAQFNNRKLKELFRRHIGMPAGKFKTFVRMEKARQLLLETDLPVRHISVRVGYSNPAHFSRIFKINIGITPSQIRKNSSFFP